VSLDYFDIRDNLANLVCRCFSFGRTNLCDKVFAQPAQMQNVLTRWINFVNVRVNVLRQQK